MRLRAVPHRARLAADEEAVFGQFRDAFDLADASVLEIGGCLPEPWLASRQVRRWWSVDPRNVEARGSGLRIPLRASAAAIPLAAAKVDLVFSCNAFQHIHDVAGTFRETARVLRPGGYLYANFGPVWSGPDGSHIEDLPWRGERLSFWDQALLPSWSHLVFSEEELRALLTELHGPGLARLLTDYVFRSRWINRWFHDDYRRAAEETSLEIVFWQGNGEFDYSYRPPVFTGEAGERLQPERRGKEIEKRHGADRRDFESRDIELILRRPAA